MFSILSQCNAVPKLNLLFFNNLKNKPKKKCTVLIQTISGFDTQDFHL